MKTIDASVTQRGQVTIPAELIRRLDLSVPGKVRFVISDDGSVSIERPTSRVEALRGIMPALNPPTTSEFEDEIEEAIADFLTEKYSSKARFS